MDPVALECWKILFASELFYLVVHMMAYSMRDLQRRAVWAVQSWYFALEVYVACLNGPGVSDVIWTVCGLEIVTCLK